MSLSSEAQALFDHAKNAIPRFITDGKNSALEWLYAFVAIFDPVRSQGQDYLDLTYLDGATGRSLDQHARDRGTARRLGETDDTLRERLRAIEDMVTEPALKAGVNAILEAAGISTDCSLVNLRRDRGHFHAIGSCNAFMSRGYRMTNATRPQGYIVILPYGTTAATASAVAEYLRQNGPGGYNAYVERRLNP